MGTRKTCELRLYGVLLLNFLLFGITLTIISATLPKIIRQFEWSYLCAGIVLSAASVGYFASTFISGFLVTRFGAKAVICLGLLFQASGLGLFGVVQGIPFNFLMALLIGIGEGSTDVVTNCCVVRMETPGENRLINVMHSSFPVGAIIGPMAMGCLIKSGYSWQLIYRSIAALNLLIAGVLVILNFGSVTKEHDEASPHGAMSDLISNPLLVSLIITIFLYVGCELGVSSWISEYFVRIFDFMPSFGAFMVSIFWLGILIGRLSVPLLCRRLPQVDVILGLVLLSGIFLPVSIMVNDPVGAELTFFLCGLGFSAVYPIGIALIGEHIKAGQSVAIGLVATAGGIGSFTFPFIIGAIAAGYGIRSSFWFFVAANIVLVGTTASLRWLVRRSVRSTAVDQAPEHAGG